MNISKSDWKQFRERLPIWQERYMAKLNLEYIEILSSTQGNPSDRFWLLDKRIKEDKRSPGVRLELRKQDMAYNIVRLLQDGCIAFEDISDFSAELQEAVKALSGSCE